MKFGGTSVKDADAIGQLCRIVASEPRPTLLVVSALAGVTDGLIDLAATAGRGDRQALPPLIETLRRRHLDLATEIIPAPARDALIDAIADTVRELEALVHAVSVLHELSARSADAIAASGEALSARLVACALAATGGHAACVDATQILAAATRHGSTPPRSWSPTMPTAGRNP
jgi:aspartokinase